MSVDLHPFSVGELLSLHSAVEEELRDRSILRSANKPTGDYAEYLFCTAFGWTQAPPSAKGYDATDAAGLRYQIKARRLHRRNRSRQLSAIRNLSDDPFDVLAAVLFDEGYRVLRAALVPRGVVRERATYVAHTNSSRFLLHDAVWTLPTVRDVTATLQSAVPRA